MLKIFSFQKVSTIDRANIDESYLDWFDIDSEYPKREKFIRKKQRSEKEKKN